MNKDIILNEFGRVSEAMGWDSHHSPKSLASTLAVEAAKLLDQFRWLSDVESEMIDDEAHQKEIASHIADLHIYLTVLCHKLDMDPWSAVKDKLLHNREKYIEKMMMQHSDIPQALVQNYVVATPVANSAPLSTGSANQAVAEDIEAIGDEWQMIARRIANSRAEVRAASRKLKEQRLKK